MVEPAERASPDGEEHRLRFVQPLSSEITKALQSAKNSPACICDEELQSLVAYIGCGILRVLVRGAEMTRHEINGTKSYSKAAGQNLS